MYFYQNKFDIIFLNNEKKDETTNNIKSEPKENHATFIPLFHKIHSKIYRPFYRLLLKMEVLVESKMACHCFIKSTIKCIIRIMRYVPGCIADEGFSFK